MGRDDSIFIIEDDAIPVAHGANSGNGCPQYHGIVEDGDIPNKPNRSSASPIVELRRRTKGSLAGRSAGFASKTAVAACHTTPNKEFH